MPAHRSPTIQRPMPKQSNGSLDFVKKTTGSHRRCLYQIQVLKIKILSPLASAPLPPHASSPGHCHVGPTMQQLPPPSPAGAGPSSSSASAPQSLVSRACTAIQSAATRVLTDIKADLRGTHATNGIHLSSPLRLGLRI
jgi:Rab3 GTPase-activating protein catalytic subunit